MKLESKWLFVLFLLMVLFLCYLLLLRVDALEPAVHCCLYPVVLIVLVVGWLFSWGLSRIKLV